MFSWQFECDLASHRVEEMKRFVRLSGYSEGSQHYDWYTKAYNLRSQMQRQKKRSRGLYYGLQEPLSEEVRAEIQKEYDSVRKELLLRAAKISSLWMEFFGGRHFLEQREREKLGMRKSTW